MVALKRVVIGWVALIFMGVEVIRASWLYPKAQSFPRGSEPCFAPVPYSDDPTSSLIALWNCPGEIQLSVKNSTYLFLTFLVYLKSTEGRGPVSPAEVENSPYNLIPFSELENPYFHRPIRFTDTPTPGDVSLTFQKFGENHSVLWLKVWVKDPDPNHPDRLVEWESRGGYDKFDLNFDQRLGNSSFFQTGSPIEKKVFALNYLLLQAGHNANKFLKHPAREWEEFLQVYPWAKKLKNPYTGAPIQNVSHKVASAGDCTYYWEKYEWDEEAKELKEVQPPPDYSYFDPGLDVYCYSDKGEPLGEFAYRLKSILDHNRIVSQWNGPIYYIP